MVLSLRVKHGATKRPKRTPPHTNTGIWVFTAVLTRKSQKLETIEKSINWWMNKQNVYYPHCGVLFSRKNGIKHWHRLQHGQTLKTFQQRESSHAPKATYYMIPSTVMPRRGPPTETKCRLAVARGLGGQRERGIWGFFGEQWTGSGVRQWGSLPNITGMLNTTNSTH